ncbi:MAG: PorV/PorQ family protein [Ignavibacteriae bacterium]|nr:PorV/PorQ family protein [Ignavibacteriota bacterium]
MKKLFIITMLAAMPLLAQEFKKVGQSGFVFLEIPASARIAALGEAAVALSDVGADAAFANPAALGWIEKSHSASFSYAPWFADTKHYAAAYAFNSPIGVFGLGAVLFDFGSMPRTEFVSGNRVYDILGEFKADAVSLGLSYSRKLTDQFSFGVTLKYVRETIDMYHANNVLFDGGIMYYTGVGSWRIGASIQHFGTETEYITDQFKMPSILRLGAAAEILGTHDSDVRVTAMLEALHPTDGQERINVACEVGLLRTFVLRGGYKFFYDEESYSFGAGVLPQSSLPAGVDFAFVDYGRLGNVIRLTVFMEVN